MRYLAALRPETVWKYTQEVGFWQMTYPCCVMMCVPDHDSAQRHRRAIAQVGEDIKKSVSELDEFDSDLSLCYLAL